MKKLYDTAAQHKQIQQFDIFSYLELHFSFYHTFRFLTIHLLIYVLFHTSL